MTREERARLGATAVYSFGGGLCWGVLGVEWGWAGWLGWLGVAMIVVGMASERARG